MIINKILNLRQAFISVLLTFITFFSFAQDGLIEGTIRQVNGDTLENVKVSVLENPRIKVFSNDQGYFSISANTGQHLIISHNNMFQKTVEIVGGKKQYLIELDERSKLIDVGFNTKIRKDEITASVGNLQMNEANNKTVLNPANAFFGEIAGLRLFQNASTTPDNRNPGMDIRGISTTGNNSILVLIDGVERPLNSVTQNEIESVTVLRDAAAKAKYGSKGANGVLLINTKRGNRGQTKFSVSYEQGITQPTRLPEFLNAADYAKALNEGLENDGLDARYTENDIARFESGDYPTLWPDVNWMDQTLGDYGGFSTFNFNASGGDEIINYYAALNYQNENGFYKHTNAFDEFSTQIDHDQLNVRTNLDINLTSSTFVQANVAGYIKSNQEPAGGNIMDNVYSIPSAIFPVQNFDGSWGGSNQFSGNPVADINATGYNMSHMRSFMVDLRLDQNLNNILEGLGFELFAGYDNHANFDENKNKTYIYKEILPIVDSSGAIVDTTINELGEDTDLSPSRSPGNTQTTHYDIRGKLKYHQVFGMHSINAFTSYQQEHMQMRGSNNSFRYQNVIGNLRYGLANKYFFDATITYAGTNRIQEKEDRYELYPAIAGAWVISKESFMNGIGFINNMKLKASYGKAGNSSIPIMHLTQAKYGAAGGYIFGDQYRSVSGMGENLIPITAKKYESSLELNFGIEAQLIDNLYFNGEYFQAKRENIFVSPNGLYSETIGIYPESVPEGSVENYGYELELRWEKQRGDISYFLAGLFSQYKNKVININEEYRPYDYLKREGRAVNQHFGWETDGFYSQSDIEAIENGNMPEPLFGEVQAGDAKYVDQNGDGFIDQYDQTPLSNTPSPELYFSGSFGFGYKGFHISALFQGTQKSTAYLANDDVFWPLRDNGNISTWYDNYWSEDNSENAELPRLSAGSNSHNMRKNDIWLHDNNYIKLRYAEISYSFPQKLVSRLKLNMLNIYLRGNNLFSIDDIDYVDPENLWGSYPTLRTFNAGIKVTF